MAFTTNTKVFIIIVMVFACNEEDNLSFLDTIPAPSNVSALFNITQDNTGLVTIFPTAEGAIYFDIYFGDTTTDHNRLGVAICLVFCSLSDCWHLSFPVRLASSFSITVSAVAISFLFWPILSLVKKILKIMK